MPYVTFGKTGKKGKGHFEAAEQGEIRPVIDDAARQS